MSQFWFLSSPKRQSKPLRVISCSKLALVIASLPPFYFPPRPADTRNHNALNDALALHAAIRPGRTLLTHIGHDLDSWLMANPDALPPGVATARDGQQLTP